MNITVWVPGAVYEDYLDPLATGMESELGLPDPTVRRRGRGHRFQYSDVTPEAATELASYLQDRAELLLGQGVDNEDAYARATHRRAIEVATEIRDNLHKEKTDA